MSEVILRDRLHEIVGLLEKRCSVSWDRSCKAAGRDDAKDQHYYHGKSDAYAAVVSILRGEMSDNAKGGERGG